MARTGGSPQRALLPPSIILHPRPSPAARSHPPLPRSPGRPRPLQIQRRWLHAHLPHRDPCPCTLSPCPEICSRVSAWGHSRPLSILPWPPAPSFPRTRGLNTTLSAWTQPESSIHLPIPPPGSGPRKGLASPYKSDTTPAILRILPSVPSPPSTKPTHSTPSLSRPQLRKAKNEQRPTN